MKLLSRSTLMMVLVATFLLTTSASEQPLLRQFRAGDKVSVFSESANRWYDDGVVTCSVVTPADGVDQGQAAGQRGPKTLGDGRSVNLPQGWVKVSFKGGAEKSIPPADITRLLSRTPMEPNGAFKGWSVKVEGKWMPIEVTGSTYDETVGWGQTSTTMDQVIESRELYAMTLYCSYRGIAGPPAFSTPYGTYVLCKTSGPTIQQDGTTTTTSGPFDSSCYTPGAEQFVQVHEDDYGDINQSGKPNRPLKKSNGNSLSEEEKFCPTAIYCANGRVRPVQFLK